MENYGSYGYDQSGDGYNSGFYQGYPDDGTQGGYYEQQDPNAAYGSYQTNADQPYYHQQAQYNYQSSEPWAPTTTPKGSYAQHDVVSPQLFGYPVSALGFDDAYQAMYVPLGAMK